MAPVAVTAVTVVGYVIFRRPEPPPARLAILDVPVCFRIVARGDNIPAVQGTVRSIREPRWPRSRPFRTRSRWSPTGRFPLPPAPEIVPLVVPDEYRTPRASLYKARALQFAVEHSTLPDTAWIMHLDEESHITRSVVLGISRAVAEEHGSESPRIGQGLILYHRNLEEDLIFGLADSIRSGDDVGRFYLQHRLGVTLFGLHGSFILVRNDIEKEIGFDVGPEGSVTEDAFWALEQMALGRRCRWVDGVVVEQAPQRLADFLKQRRRWFVGLCQVVRHAPVPLRWRLPLAFSIGAWSLAWLGVVYTYVNLATGIDTPALDLAGRHVRVRRLRRAVPRRASNQHGPPRHARLLASGPALRVAGAPGSGLRAHGGRRRRLRNRQTRGRFPCHQQATQSVAGQRSSCWRASSSFRWRYLEAEPARMRLPRAPRRRPDSTVHRASRARPPVCPGPRQPTLATREA